MTETKRKPGRPATGVMSPLEHKQALLEAGGKIMSLRITAEPKAALDALLSTGDYRTATNAISAMLVEGAQRRKLIPKSKKPTDS